jgi:hypothetical protein
MGMDAARERARQKDRLKALILLVSERERDDEYFGSIKLNKILFNIDFKTYAHRGESITGHEYQAEKLGPVLTAMVAVVDEMKTDGSLGIEPEQVIGGYKQHRPVALQDADTSLFSADELARIEAEIKDARGKTAAEMTEVSHDFVGWKLSRFGETIPYETVYAMKPGKLTHRERELAREHASRAEGA